MRRAARLLPVALFALLGLSDWAVGAAGRWDVKDTHDRLDRIYEQLGIAPEEPAPKPREGCGCDKETARPKHEPPSASITPPALPAWLGYLLIAAILAAMLIPLAYVLRSSFREQPAAPELAEEEAEVAPPGEAPRGPWVVDLSQARRLADAGRLAEAFAALHRATLLGLERGLHLTLEETTTNWEYVRRLVSKPALKEVLTQATVAAERSVLGQRPPGIEQFDALERLVYERVREERA